jgi:hypothetical protein
VENDAKVQETKYYQTIVRGIVGCVIILISAVALNSMNEDRAISKCIEKTNQPVECSMAFDGYGSDKVLYNAIQEIKAERK